MNQFINQFIHELVHQFLIYLFNHSIYVYTYDYVYVYIYICIYIYITCKWDHWPMAFFFHSGAPSLGIAPGLKTYMVKLSFGDPSGAPGLPGGSPGRPQEVPGGPAGPPGGKLHKRFTEWVFIQFHGESIDFIKCNTILRIRMNSSEAQWSPVR